MYDDLFINTIKGVYTPKPSGRKMLILGDNGHIGEVLLERLKEEGHSINVICSPTIETVSGDIFQDVEVCFVLAYDLEPVDVPIGDTEFLKTLRESALRAGVSRIVLLTAIKNSEPNRPVFFDVIARVETILGGSAIPLTSFRSSILLGTEMVFIRAISAYTTEHSSPVLPPESRVHECQPILLSEAIEMIAQAANHELERSYHFDIGGFDTLSYQALVTLFVNKEKNKKDALGVQSLGDKNELKKLGQNERIAWSVFLEKTKDNMLVEREGALEYFEDINITPLMEAIYKI